MGYIANLEFWNKKSNDLVADIFSLTASRAFTLRLRKVDFVLAVGIWVGFGPDLGLEINKRLNFYAFYKPNLTINNRDMCVYYS